MKKAIIAIILVVVMFTGCGLIDNTPEYTIPEPQEPAKNGIVIEYANVTNRGYIPIRLEYELVHFTGTMIDEDMFLSPTSTETILNESLIVGEWYMTARLYDRNGLVAEGECVFIVQAGVVTNVELILEVVSGDVSIKITE